MEKTKKSKKDRERELRNDGMKKGGVVNFSAVVDRQVGDHRFERERAMKIKTQEEGLVFFFVARDTILISCCFHFSNVPFDIGLVLLFVCLFQASRR